MKVTDEMVDRAIEAWGLDESDYSPEELAEHRADMRRTLETALADVPEPADTKSWLVLVKKLGGKLEAAEAKLAKIRACLDENHWTVRGDARTEMLAILDGEP